MPENVNRSQLVPQPNMYIGDSTGRPLDYGMVYFGEPDKDPEFYPIDIFADQDLTVPLAQPVRTKGGYLYDKGDVVRVYSLNGEYSVKVKDQYNREVYYVAKLAKASIGEIAQDQADYLRGVINTKVSELNVVIDLLIKNKIKSSYVYEGERTQAQVNSDQAQLNSVLSNFKASQEEINTAQTATNSAQAQTNALLQSNINSVSGGYWKSFATLVELQAATGMTANQVAKVMNDTTAANNGDYRYTGSAWVKGYDALTDAKAYTDSKMQLTSLYKEANNVSSVYVATDGSIASGSGTKIAVIPVQAGKTYAVKSPDFRADRFIIALRTSNSAAVGATLGKVTLSDTADPTVKTFSIPSNSTATYALVNVTLTQADYDISNSFGINEGTTYISEPVIDYVNGARVINPFSLASYGYIGDAQLTKIPQLYNSANNASGVYVNLSNAYEIASAAGLMLTNFPVTAGKTYAIKANSFKTTAFAVTLRDSSSTAAGTTLGKVTLTDTADPTVKTFTVPSDSTATYALINIVVPSQNFDIRYGLIISEGIVIEGTVVTNILGYGLADAKARKDLEALKTRLNPLLNKKWLAIGDSITEKNFRTNLNYHDFIKNDVGGMTVYNYGQSGTGFFSRYNVASQVTQNVADIDLVTVFLGTNDFDHANLPLGTLADTGTTTISGCINTLLTGLITKFYNKKIALFTPLPRSNNWGSNAAPNSNGYTLEQLANLIKQYCNHYSLPCLDLYHQSSLPVWDSNGNTYYFTAPGNTTPDGLHPNDAGQRVLADKIKAFLETI